VRRQIITLHPAAVSGAAVRVALCVAVCVAELGQPLFVLLLCARRLVTNILACGKAISLALHLITISFVCGVAVCTVKAPRCVAVCVAVFVAVCVAVCVVESPRCVAVCVVVCVAVCVVVCVAVCVVVCVAVCVMVHGITAPPSKSSTPRVSSRSFYCRVVAGRLV